VWGAREWGKLSSKEKTQMVKGRSIHKELHCCKPSGSASVVKKCYCINIEKKRVVMLDSRKSVKGHDENLRVFDKIILMYCYYFL